ncbi:hypothetical protein [Bacillus sp. 03113]|uniref:hypothetical protein n=1 Tax=Bacillus sp. 03113 TaxID=2578211 RepID=UPI001144F7A3|nr:hypothetical protein [Bacillus sp. 03113]
MKGQTVTQPLTGKDIFIGRNGTGKTTRVQSLGLSMLGYVPGQGKTAADTFKLATGEEMVVGLKTDSFQFQRKFKKEEKLNKKTGERKVSIKETLSVSPGQGERNETEKKARIAEEIGSFPVALDFNEFLSLSGAKRRDFIYSLSPISSNTWTREQVENYLADQLLTIHLKTNNPDQYYIMVNLIEQSLKQYPEHLGIHEGLQSMLDWTTNELSYWSRKQKDAQGAVRQMADMKNKMAETDRNIGAAKKELEEFQEKLLEVEKKISGDEQQKKNIDRRLARIEELKQLIDSIEKEPIQIDTSELDQKIARLQSEMPLPLDIDNDIKIFNQNIKVANDELIKIQQEGSSIKEQIMTIRSTIKSLEAALNKVNELGGACIINQMIACPKDFTGFDLYIDKQKEKASGALQTLEEQQGELTIKVDEYLSIINKNEEDKTNLFKKAQEVQKQREQMTAEVNQLEKEREKRLTAAERKEHKLSIYREELAKLVNEKDEPIGDLALMRLQADGTKNCITELDQSIKEKEKSKQAILLMQQNVLENREAEHKSVCLKSIQEALGPKGIQGELVKEILEPIRSQIQENLQLMGFEQKPFFQTESDTGKEIFEFGWINEHGHEVNFDALSTGQQTVFLAAMMMTIIDRAQPKLRILVMDNLNHLDKQNFQLLVDGLDKLAPNVDNIIIAGALEYEFSSDGWEVTDLSSKEGELYESA